MKNAFVRSNLISAALCLAASLAPAFALVSFRVSTAPALAGFYIVAGVLALAFREYRSQPSYHSDMTARPVPFAAHVQSAPRGAATAVLAAA